jgi:predicted metal-dependent phosphotriesterase family hydrolase
MGRSIEEAAMPVQTVRGERDAADLGRVLMHEHVFVLGAELTQNDAC